MRVVLIILVGRKATVSVIRNCCPVKRSPANGLKHQTQALNAISNGGDASRVGKRISYYLMPRRETRRSKFAAVKRRSR